MKVYVLIEMNRDPDLDTHTTNRIRHSIDVPDAVSEQDVLEALAKLGESLRRPKRTEV